MVRIILRRIVVFMALLCIFLPAVTAAPETGGGDPLTLDEALLHGLENNISLQKSRIDLAAAEYSSRRLWAEVFPTMNANLGASYSSALFSGDGFKFDQYGGAVSSGLEIRLGLNAGIPYAMKNIKLAYQTRLLSYEDARKQIAIQITKNFFRLITEKNNLNYLEDILKLAVRQYERNRVAFNNGMTGELAVLQSSLSVETARYNLSAASSSYANSMMEFLAALGMEPDADISLTGTIEITKIEVDADALIRERLHERPDIVSGRREIERLENEEKQKALAAKAPAISLSAQWSGRNARTRTNPNADPFTDSLTGSASLSIPIDPWVPGTKNAQSIRSAKLAVEKAKFDLKAAEDAAAVQIRSLAANLRNSWDSVEIARLSLNAAERGYTLSEQGFRNGAVESLALEDARNNLASARQRLLQSELSYLNLILDLSAALNIDWKELMQ